MDQTTINNTIAPLKAAHPEWTPVFDLLTPAFARMAQQEIFDWVMRAVASGDEFAAMVSLLAKITPDPKENWTTLNDAGIALNGANAAKAQWRRDAIGAMCEVAMAIALPLVGL